MNIKKIERKKIVPLRLKQARVSRSMSMNDLAEMVGVTRQTISQYEMGKIEPSDKVLNDMSLYLKYPVQFFYKEILQSQVNNSLIFFRSKKTTKVKDKNAAEIKINLFKEINDYLEKFVDFPKVNFPEIEYPDYDVETLSLEEIEEIAMKVREFWSLGEGPINNLIQILQINGVLCTRIVINNKKLDGFSQWLDNRPYIFLSDDKKSSSRTRFSLAHELGHLIMHVNYLEDEYLSSIENKNNIKIIEEKFENEANMFAAAFLMPKESFSKDIYSSSLEHFINLKKKWKVSIQSMIYRCADLELLSENQIDYLKRQLSTKRYWSIEPLDNKIPIEKPFIQRQSIELLLEHKIVTPLEICNDIMMYPSEIEEFCFLDKDTLNYNTFKNDNIVELKFR